MPGLKYTVEKYGTGVCVDIYDINSVIKGIESIENHYSLFSENSTKLLRKFDMEKLLWEVFRKQ